MDTRRRAKIFSLVVSAIIVIPLSHTVASIARLGWDGHGARVRDFLQAIADYGTGNILDKIVMGGVYFFESVAFAALAGLALFAIAIVILMSLEMPRHCRRAARVPAPMSDERRKSPIEPVISRRSFIKGAGAVAAAAGLVGVHSAGAEEDASNEGIAERLGPNAQAIELKINGETHRLAIEPRVTLLGALREHLGMTGTKLVCDRGACGACTVHLDGRPVTSCMVLRG